MSKIAAQNVVDELEAAFAELPPGAKRIKVDSLEADLSIADAIKQLEYWRSRAAKETGNRPRISSIDLS